MNYRHGHCGLCNMMYNANAIHKCPTIEALRVQVQSKKSRWDRSDLPEKGFCLICRRECSSKFCSENCAMAYQRAKSQTISDLLAWLRRRESSWVEEFVADAIEEGFER